MQKILKRHNKNTLIVSHGKCTNTENWKKDFYTGYKLHQSCSSFGYDVEILSPADNSQNDNIRLEKGMKIISEKLQENKFHVLIAFSFGGYSFFSALNRGLIKKIPEKTILIGVFPVKEVNFPKNNNTKVYFIWGENDHLAISGSISQLQKGNYRSLTPYEYKPLASGKVKGVAAEFFIIPNDNHIPESINFFSCIDTILKRK